ncbi:TPA: hypothetical protein ACGUVV_004835 [Vibrio vulnificus]
MNIIFITVVSSLLGVVFGFSLQGGGVILLSIFSISSLFFIIKVTSRKINLILPTIIFYLSYYLVTSYWVLSYFNMYIDMNYLKILLFISIAFLHAIYSSVPILLAKYLNNFTSALPIFIVIFELLKEFIPFIYPWLRPSVILISANTSWLFRTIGSYGVDFLFYFFCVFVLNVIEERKVSKNDIKIIFSILSLFILDKVNLSDNNKEETITVSVLHENTPSRRLSNLEAINDYLLSSININSDMYVWPEGIYHINKEELNYFSDKYEGTLSKTIFGMEGYLYDYKFNYLTSGKYAYPLYVKENLVPFSEYTPSWIRYIYSGGGNLNEFSSYDKFIGEYIPFNDKLNIVYMICYDTIFTKFEQGDIIVVSSSLLWAKDNWLKVTLLNFTRIRAAETNMPVFYSTNGGISAIIEGDSSLLSYSDTEKQEFITSTVIYSSNNRTLYVLSGGISLVLFFSFYLFIFFRIK